MAKKDTDGTVPPPKKPASDLLSGTGGLASEPAGTPAGTSEVPPAATPPPPAPSAPEAPPAGVIARKGSGNAPDTVTVALNFNAGLEFALPGRRRLVLKGSAAHLAGVPLGGPIPVGGFGLTPGVPLADWEYVKEKPFLKKLIRKGLCYATVRKEDAEAEAQDRNGLRHGYEPSPVTGQAKE